MAERKPKHVRMAELKQKQRQIVIPDRIARPSHFQIFYWHQCNICTAEGHFLFSLPTVRPSTCTIRPSTHVWNNILFLTLSNWDCHHSSFRYRYDACYLRLFFLPNGLQPWFLVYADSDIFGYFRLPASGHLCSYILPYPPRLQLPFDVASTDRQCALPSSIYWLPASIQRHRQWLFFRRRRTYQQPSIRSRCFLPYDPCTERWLVVLGIFGFPGRPFWYSFAWGWITIDWQNGCYRPTVPFYCYGHFGRWPFGWL